MFVNRLSELRKLRESEAGLTVVFGRRRVGKTSLIDQWKKSTPIFYSQAIEGAESIQIIQLIDDLEEILPKGIKAGDWAGFLSILSLIKKPCIIAIDEFPYLVKSNSSLPSRLQKWIDHDRPKNVRLVLLGSSQTMMNGIFLSSKSPLYERADLILHIEPMGFRYFCESLGLDSTSSENFEKYAMVGGVPRYWQYIKTNHTLHEIADNLFFSKTAHLEYEPDRLLKDEDINGMQAKSIFECIGRGARRPSEIATRMGIEQTALSKPMQILLHTSLVKRVLPFAESFRNSKKILYAISDYALMFWYGCYSPHRSRWHVYSPEQKTKIVHDHSAQVLEDCYRNQFPDGARYWEGQKVEFDCVRHSSQNPDKLIITEIKHREMSVSEKNKIAKDLVNKFIASSLSNRYQLDRVEVMGISDVLKVLHMAQ